MMCLLHSAHIFFGLFVLMAPGMAQGKQHGPYGHSRRQQAPHACSGEWVDVLGDLARSRFDPPPQLTIAQVRWAQEGMYAVGPCRAALVPYLHRR